MTKKSFVLACLVALGLVRLYVYNGFLTGKSRVLEPVEMQKLAAFKLYPTRNWMVNNNVMQYSSYVIQKKDSNKAEIQIIVKINVEAKLVKFLCLIKRVSTGELIKVEPYRVVESIRPHVKKLFMQIDVMNHKLENVGIALIRSEDFSETLVKPKRLESGTYVLPFHMINFQKPETIYETTRIKNVAMCVPITYSKEKILYEHFVQWNKEFGIGKLVLYDATPNKILSKLVGNDEVVKIRPYCVEYECICNTEHLSFSARNDTSLEVYVDLCKKLYNEFFKNLYNTRLTHEDITSNDCFIETSHKYEFTSLYDFDEFIFPRTINFSSRSHVEPFSLTLYEYIQGLVEKYFKHDVNKLAGVEVPHAAYLTNDEHAVQVFIQNLNELAFKIENKNFDDYPIRLNLTFDNSHGHVFTIKREDSDYVVYLSEKYELYLCLLKAHVLSNNTSLSSNLLRFFYHISNRAERLPKFIHYYKNVFAIWAHGALKTAVDSAYLKLSDETEYVLAHFRNDVRLLYKNYHEGTIRKLKIDHEYMAFLLKKNNHTSSCQRNTIKITVM